MADVRLLKLVDSLADERSGNAPEKAVKEAYGAGYERAVREAWEDGHLDRQGAIGYLKLSSYGRELARQ